MKIKRNFTYVGAARKFKVFINDEHVSDVKLLREIDVEQPNSKFSLYFSTMMYEKSKKYYIDSNQEVRIVVNANPLVRLFFFISYIAYVLLFIYSINNYKYVSLIVIGLILFQITFYFAFLTNIFITFKVYDLDSKRVHIEEIKE